MRWALALVSARGIFPTRLVWNANARDVATEAEDSGSITFAMTETAANQLSLHRGVTQPTDRHGLLDTNQQNRQPPSKMARLRHMERRAHSSVRGMENCFLWRVERDCRRTSGRCATGLEIGGPEPVSAADDKASHVFVCDLSSKTMRLGQGSFLGHGFLKA